jgi:hypothetical protein
VIALAISVATYLDQHRADAASYAATRQYAASQVSYWIQQAGVFGPLSLIVENRSYGPISHVELHFYEKPGDRKRGDTELWVLPGIPPCTLATVASKKVSVALSGISDSDTDVYSGPGIPVSSLITFTDSAGASWTRYSTGELVSRWTPPPETGFYYGNATFKPADGCS